MSPLIRILFWGAKLNNFQAANLFWIKGATHIEFSNSEVATKQNKIQLFEPKQVRTIWDEDQEKWFFSTVDVVGILTDSPNPRRIPVHVKDFNRFSYEISLVRGGSFGK